MILCDIICQKKTIYTKFGLHFITAGPHGLLFSTAQDQISVSVSKGCMKTRNKRDVFFYCCMRTSETLLYFSCLLF